jgi:hypothetical protein
LVPIALADTKQSQNEKVIEKIVYDENFFDEKCDKKFFKDLEQFGNKRISPERSLRQLYFSRPCAYFVPNIFVSIFTLSPVSKPLLSLATVLWK